MTSGFTHEHFEHLNKWKGQKRTESDPEQDHAYDELKRAYELTEAWALGVRAKLFPDGVVKVRKRPTSQGNYFVGYNWARIYPATGSPEHLAYTVGIDAERGFVVKIDTVQAEPALRARYEALRGPFDDDSPIVSVLSKAAGLSKSVPELVRWSVSSILNFRLSYDEMVARLNLGNSLTDEDLLRHFDGKAEFKTFRASWGTLEKEAFCRLARAVHVAGLDWWHVDVGIQVRFGRKSVGSGRAVGVVGIVGGVRSRHVEWRHDFGTSPDWHRDPLNDAIADQIGEHLSTNRDELAAWLTLDVERPGLWPDQLRDESSHEGEEAADEAPTVATTKVQAVNRIYYGPPGTGKTYEVSKLLKRAYEQALSSVTEEEWRMQFLVDRISVLTWWEGVAAALYDLGKSAKVSELLAHPFVQAISAARTTNRNVRATVWAILQMHAQVDSELVKYEKRTTPLIFDKAEGSSWHFAGEWEEECSDLIALVNELNAGPPQDGGAQTRYSFVTFHQSYGYEEFVEGLRPLLDVDGEAGDIRYEIKAGSFKELCRRARLAPEHRFAMVIDEINRGNISKIFGELITLIEPDKREGADNAVSVILPYSGDTFSVPANVDILGTMNTADRSLALMDTALRRRFEFMPVMPDTRDEDGSPLFGLRVTSDEQVIDIPRLLGAINQRIAALYDRDHCIGHAYFTQLGSVPDGDERLVALAQLFSKRILPLLEEYFFEDWQKIRLVLADNQKPAPAQFIVEALDHQDDLARLFGDDHGLDSYTTQRSYAVQEAAFSYPEAYLGIYQTLTY
jgi:5-methylcytosine-specific restriction protein B